MKALALIAAVALALTGCATAPADRFARGAELMAQLKAASGGAALDAPQGFHETGEIVAANGTRTYETWADLGALRTLTAQTMGGVTVVHGFDGRVMWVRSASGTVETFDEPEAVATGRLSAYLTIGGYYYPDRFPARFEYAGQREADGVRYDVVTVTPEGASPIDLWLDVETHRLQRLSAMDGSVVFTAVVERYEVVDGAWVAFTIRQSVGNQEQALRLRTVEFVAVPPERFSPSP